MWVKERTRASSVCDVTTVWMKERTRASSVCDVTTVDEREDESKFCV